MNTKGKGRFPWLSTGVGTLTLALCVLLLRLPWAPIQHFAWWVIALYGTFWVARTGWWMHTSRSSQALINKWNKRATKTSGMAAGREHRQFTSKAAVRRLGPQVRPTTYGGHRPRQVPVGEVATELARIGGIRVPRSRKVILGRPVWSSIEHHTLTIGPPGTGKSGSLACRIIDAPGAVVAVSTTGDLYENTVALRAAKGPVYVMNLGNVAGIPNNVKWSVLAGCKDPQVADDRAKDMIPVTSVEGGTSINWKELAQSALGMLMHAAACDDRSMKAVYRWITVPDGTAYNEVYEALASSPEEVPMRSAAEQFFKSHKPTRDGIVTAMMPALRWLRNSRVVSIGDHNVPEELFNISDVIDQRGTVYIIGEEKHTTAGLVTALITEIVRASREKASQMRRQRLDPPLCFALDEAALVCWVPLHSWTAELRARGITIHIAIQARSQLRARWGDRDTGTILTNCTSVIVYGGCKDPDDLRTYASMSGWRREPTESTDDKGKVTSRSTQRVPVLDEGAIAALEGGTAVIFRRDMRPYLARPRMVWERRDYLAAQRSGGAAMFQPEVEDTKYETATRVQMAEEDRDGR